MKRLRKWLTRLLYPSPETSGPKVTIHWNGSVSIDWISWFEKPEGQKRLAEISKPKPVKVSSLERALRDGYQEDPEGAANEEADCHGE